MAFLLNILHITGVNNCTTHVPSDHCLDGSKSLKEEQWINLNFILTDDEDNYLVFFLKGGCGPILHNSMAKCKIAISRSGYIYLII